MNCEILHYKGYDGTIEYSEEDGCLFGKVKGIRSLISYEGQTIEELRMDFEAGVDDYLELCERYSVEAEVPDSES